MSDSVSKCGRPGKDSRACKPADYADCDDLKSADLTQLISYNGHGLGLVAPGLDRRKFKVPSFKQIRDMDWSKFAGQDGVCQQGNKWFAYKSRQTAPSAEAAQVDSQVAAPVAKKGFFDQIFDPIEAGLELAMKGRFEKAAKEVGPERLAGVGVAALLGLIVVYNLIRWPFRVAKKNRVAVQRKEAARMRAAEASKEEQRLREFDDARRQAMDAQVRADRAVAAVHEAVRVAQELAANRERTPTPRPAEIYREDTPLPLMQRSDTPAEGIRIEAEKTYADGREYDKTDPNLRPMVSVSVNFDVIDAVLDIKGTPLVEIEKEFGFEIKPAELKKAAILAQAFPIEGKTLVETTTEYLTIGSVFEKKDAEVLSEKAIIRAVGHFSQEKVSTEAAKAALAPYGSWFKTGEVVTDDYKEWWRLKEKRLTLVPDGVAAQASPVRDPMTVEVRPAGVPSGVNTRDLKPTGMIPAPRGADRSMTADVAPERLAEMEAEVEDDERLRRARQSVVVLDDSMFSGFSEKELGGDIWGGKRVDSFLGDADPHYDSSAVMRNALAALKEHEKYSTLTDTDKAKLADIFTSAVVGKKAIPGFAKDYYRDGKVDHATFGEGMETARSLMQDNSAQMGRSRGLKPRTEERKSGISGFEDLFSDEEAKEARSLTEKALDKGGK